MLINPRCSLLASTLVVAVGAVAWHATASAAKATECTKAGICYCVNEDLKPTIQTKVDRFRQLISEQRKAGKVARRLS